jgi:hypothetical protein
MATARHWQINRSSVGPDLRVSLIPAFAGKKAVAVVAVAGS